MSGLNSLGKSNSRFTL